MNPCIRGVGLAHPPHKVGQPEVRDLVRTLFDGLQGLDRLITVFENTGITSRHLSAPLEWFSRPHGFAEKNRRWFETALELCEKASLEALAQAGLRPEQVGAIVLVTTTGIATPSLEAHLVERLGLPLSAVRLPIWGLGCAGGAAGLARAAELARLHEHVLLVAVELCSLTFVRGDLSKSNLVATSLFADGAAAAVLGTPQASEGPAVLGSFSRLLPNSYEVMGWDVVDEGLQVRFAQSIPALVEGRLGHLIQDGLASFGLTAQDLHTWTLHPGGAKVLAAYQHGLGVDEGSLEAARCVLKNFGNMSSPTVLFVLARQMYQLERPPSGSLGLLLALGPGFAAEGVVLRW
ncbi:MAG: 3-oxoacyl-[acyl-carrier-protein] synthase III C-terminal domain-containing protein [Meiothermus sp.]|uniref:type III polyketide synthase n=1 Tax=Meiothermus sp. TaxID=1955249 RepID=UPI0025D873D6|nr:3-oxoacyl-[acyl-carrier-protein] synthase III C-terminal domain-containing protein [Meiothermus sp.]MCS7069543.1 stilbene synthase [Meiothermus sp.]MDW8426066.1 3-oxoacyl-[acyl-carrier-protein] synthase III C-terminal domain-containing protein [Meiothermus sp.]